jgi:long-chain acyl-CoA synthetase
MNEFGTLASLVDGLGGWGSRAAVISMRSGGAERLSRAELGELATRLARGLMEAGVVRGDRVALFAGNGPLWVAACLGIVRAGAVVVPLDAGLDDRELGRILEHSGARLAFTDEERAGRVESFGVDPILLDGDDSEERGWRTLLADEGEPSEIEEEDLAALFYTSGTTGDPKGVPLTHRNLAFQVSYLAGADLVREDDVMLLPLPLHHVYPFVMGMLAPLGIGVPVVYPESLTGPGLARALREGEVSVVVGVPRLYEALLTGIEDQARSAGRVGATLVGGGLDLCAGIRSRTGLDAGRLLMRPVRGRIGPKVRLLASGGAPLEPDLAARLEGLGWRVAIGYGLTETSPLLTLKRPDGKKLASVGRPVPGVEVRVDRSSAPGESGDGEVQARGSGVFGGYQDNPEQTRKVFTEDGWFRTGDLGRFDGDGYLYVTGRASSLIVTPGGKNVWPENVEAAYEESLLVREAGVFQREGRLLAVIVPETGEIRRRDVDPERAVREAVSEGSKRVPSHARISEYAVSREPLERTRLGKLRRHLLPERYERARTGQEKEAPGPVPVEEMSEEDRTLLENDTARTVWEMLARRYPDVRLTPDTSPQLDLGVDSLGWVDLTMEIGGKTGVELSEEAIYRVDAVRDLLREVAEGTTGSGLSPLENPEEVLSDYQKRWLVPPGPVAGTAARGMFALNRRLARGLFSLKVEGLENLPAEGPFVISPNHVSYLDAFVVAAALDDRVLRDTYWGGWRGAAFGNPLTRAVSRLVKVVPVDPERSGISSLALGAAVLKRGKNLVWFPEGQRSPTGELRQFKGGIGALLARYRVPVVPAFIHGSREAMPPGSALPRPRGISITFGPPLHPQELDKEPGDQPLEERITEALRERIARLGGL